MFCSKPCPDGYFGIDCQVSVGMFLYFSVSFVSNQHAGQTEITECKEIMFIMVGIVQL